MSTAYERLNNLEDLELIAGNTYTLNCTVYEEDGTRWIDYREYEKEKQRHLSTK